MKRLLFLLLTICLRQTSGQTITTIAGNGTMGFSGDGGQATSAQLNLPWSVTLDASGDIFIPDYGNHRIRKINSSGVINTVAGIGTGTFSGDGGPAISAGLYRPHRTFFDATGNLFIADDFNSRIRKIDLSNNISTVAGNGSYSFSGDGSSAILAGLWGPRGVTIDVSGNMYIADNGNNRIRKVNSVGNISTYVGTGTLGYSGDGGPANLAQIFFGTDVALDASGNLYFTDEGNHRIRKVDAFGIITTVVGIGTQGFSGDGGPATSAQLDQPYGLTFDALGNLFIADLGNNRIRKVNTSGIISTVAGNGISGYSGDGGLATLAELNWPTDVEVDASGNLYIADHQNNVIRKVTYAPTGISSSNIVSSIVIYPNPAKDKLAVSGNATSGTLEIFNLTGQSIFNSKFSGKIEIDVTNFSEGIYSLVLKSDKEIATKKIIIVK